MELEYYLNTIITIEDGIVAGGFGSAILHFANANNYKQSVTIIGVKDKFVEHGTVDELYEQQGLDRHSIKKRVEHILMTTNS